MTHQDSFDILLVEDDPHDLELTLRALRKWRPSNRVVVVHDGAEALDLLFTGEALAARKPANLPHMILLDLKLPKVDGLEVLRKVKSDPRTRQIPTVIMTSSTEERDVLESYELGANSYVVKPVEFDRFEQAVRELGQYWLLLNIPPR